jgi:hypothetical protein
MSAASSSLYFSSTTTQNHHNRKIRLFLNSKISPHVFSMQHLCGPPQACMRSPINDTDRTKLDKPFTKEEIKNVIDQMEKKIKLMVLLDFQLSSINLVGT